METMSPVTKKTCQTIMQGNIQGKRRRGREEEKQAGQHHRMDPFTSTHPAAQRKRHNFKAICFISIVRVDKCYLLCLYEQKKTINHCLVYDVIQYLRVFDSTET